LLRALAVVLVIIGGVAAAVFGPKWLRSVTDPEPESREACELDRGPCQWKMNGVTWVAELERGEIGNQGREYRLRLHTGAGTDRLVAVLRGESMYLGEYPVPLSETGSDGGIAIWQARFTAPFCTVDPDMTWRIDLQQGSRSMDQLPVKMMFQADNQAG